eukprot:5414087-Amphidinium_carterae.1
MAFNSLAWGTRWGRLSVQMHTKPMEVSVRSSMRYAIISLHWPCCKNPIASPQKVPESAND